MVFYPVIFLCTACLFLALLRDRFRFWTTVGGSLGVTLLATVHAASLQDLQGRPVGRALLACGVFRRAAVIEGLGADRRSRVEPLP